MGSIFKAQISLCHKASVGVWENKFCSDSAALREEYKPLKSK